MPVTVSHAKSNTIADWSGAVTVGNSTGGSSTDQASNLVRPSDWNSVHNITFSLTGSEVAPLFSFTNGLTSTTAADGITVGNNTAAFFEPFPMINTNSTLSTLAVGSWYLDPLYLPDGMGSGRINIFRTQNASNFVQNVTITYNQTASCSKVGSFRNCLAIYSRGAGAQSTRLESIWTGQAAQSATQTFQISTTAANSTNVGITGAMTWGFITQINDSGATTSSAYTFSGTTNQSSSSMAAGTMDRAFQSSSGSSNSGFFTGSMMDMIPFNTSLPPGQYWLGHMFTTDFSGTTAGRNFTSAGTFFGTSSVAELHLLGNQLSAFKMIGRSTVGNTTSNAIPFHGVVATVSSNAFATLASSDMRNPSARLYWNYIQDAP